MKKIGVCLLAVIVTMSSMDISAFASRVSTEGVETAEEKTLTEENLDIEELSTESSIQTETIEDEIDSTKTELDNDKEMGVTEEETLIDEDIEELSTESSIQKETDKDEINSTETELDNNILISKNYNDIGIGIIDSGKCGDNLIWTLTEEGTLTISGSGDMYDYENDFVMGAGIVMTTAPWFKYKDEMNELIIQEGVTSIGENAFASCIMFTGNITIPEGITRIGDCAFYNCFNFTGELVIPGSVTSIGKEAFAGCSGLSGDLIIPDNVTSIGDSAFWGCGFTGNLKISKGITCIEDKVFAHCNRLTGDLIIPENITSIGDSAFSSCGFTGNLIIAKEVSVVGEHAFAELKVNKVFFEGRSPSINGNDSFYNVTADVYYPYPDTSWDSIISRDDKNYGGELNWISYSAGTKPWMSEVADDKPSVYLTITTDVENLSYNDELGYYKAYNDELGYYIVEVFSLKISGTYMNTNGSAYENCILTIELPDGLSFANDENIKTVSEVIDCNDDMNNSFELAYPVYFTTSGYIDRFDITLSCSADGYENPQISTYNIPVSLDAEFDAELDATADEEIISEVSKYVSDELYAQLNVIINSELDDEEKFRRLNELFNNNGLTDVREGIQYVSEASSSRRNYLFLTTNENYCAYNWWYWLNATINGRIARGLLYSDGLIFNFELSKYLDWSTYTNGSFPGVEKCKTMLKEFMEVDDQNIASNVAGNSKKLVKDIKNAIKLNDIVADAELDEIMNNVINAKTDKQLMKYQQQFADWMIKQVRIQQEIQTGKEVKLYLGTEGISKALGYAAPIINFMADTADDIVEIISLESDIQKYEEYDEFLTTIYSNPDVSIEMRVAAYQLHDDIVNGYLKKVQSILSNFITFESEMMYVDDSLLETYLESKGLSTTAPNPLQEAMGDITLATVISNIVIDAGDFVKQAAYTMSYAELATLYSMKLEDDKNAFQKESSAENAWQFYEDYNLLWRLRYMGEKQYLEMNSIKAFVFGKIKSRGYAYKEEIVHDTLNILNQCKFMLSDSVKVPESVQYIKKAVIECPVDVSVYTKEGVLVAKLEDGVLSDTVNEYGRFAVVYESYSGEYAKVICQSSDVELDIQIVSTDAGLVDYKFAKIGTNDVLSFDKVIVEKGDTIKVTDGYYQIIHDNGVEDEPKPFDSLSGDYVKPESILMNEAPLELFVGEKEVLNVSVLPNNTTNKSVSWYSEDEEIASVNNGVVVAKSVGETVIWIKACDNEEVEGSIIVNVNSGTGANNTGGNHTGSNDSGSEEVFDTSIGTGNTSGMLDTDGETGDIVESDVNIGSNNNDNANTDDETKNDINTSILKNDTKNNNQNDKEPKTGADSHPQIYATIAMIAGLSYIMLLFIEEHGMTEEEKEALIARLVGWAKHGRKFRRMFALAIIFFVLVYYHSIGKQNEVELGTRIKDCVR